MTHTEHEDRYQRRAHAMIATMDQANRPTDDRREQHRHRHLSRSTLQVETGETCREIVLYTRDVTERGVGFLAAGDLQPNTRGKVEIPGPTGEPIEVAGQLIRTRTIGSGWHEGYVRFDAPVRLFCETPIRAA